MMAALEEKRSPEYDIPSTSTNTSVSTTCKSCKKEFAVSTIFKHVSHRPTCKANYTNEEIQAFKNWKRERDEAGRNRKKHDPVKRKERYLREKDKKITYSVSQDEGKSSSEYVSSQCQGCKINFTKATILKHISHSPSCQNLYTKDDISELDAWTKQRKDQKRALKRKKCYDPEVRRAKYNEQKEMKNKLKPVLGGAHQSVNSKSVTVTTRCKNCNVLFNRSSIRKHISHSICKASYSEEEQREFRKWTDKTKSEKRKVSYNSTKRKLAYEKDKAKIASKYQENKAKIASKYQENKAKIAERYYEKVGKYKEKPIDRFSLEGQSFIKVYDQAFEVACSNFVKHLITEAVIFLHESEYYDEIYEKTFDSIFTSKLWMNYFEDDHFSKNCEETSWKTKYLNLHPKVPELCPYVYSKIPCQFHCSDLLLVELIEKSMDLAFERSLEKNTSKIATALARKSYGNPCYSDYFEHQIQNKFKKLTYKKIFAKFYHDAAFVSIYNAAFDESDIAKETCKNVRKEENVMKLVLEKSDEYVLGTISSFICGEMKTKFKLTKKHHDAWRGWLDREKQNSGSILYLSNTL